MKGLTQTQAAVLAFINEFRREQQCPPTRREIADHFGWRSANAAEDHLQALQRKGAIWLKPGRARCIHVNEAHAHGADHAERVAAERVRRVLGIGVGMGVGK